MSQPSSFWEWLRLKWSPADDDDGKVDDNKDEHHHDHGDDHDNEIYVSATDDANTLKSPIGRSFWSLPFFNSEK